MKIVVGGIYLESNTFAPVLADKDDFRISGDLSYLSDEVMSRASELDVTLLPAKFYRSVPAGALKQEVFEKFLSEFLTSVEKQIEENGADAILLMLHGSTVLEDHTHGESRILQEVRSLCGGEVIIGATFDLHGNLEEQPIRLLDYATALRTAPHTDQIETTKRALDALHYLFHSQKRGVVRLQNIPIVVPGEAMMTTTKQVGALYQSLSEDSLERSGLCGSIFAGFAWADVVSCGVSALVSGLDEGIVKEHLLALSNEVWSIRDELKLRSPLLELSEALRRVSNQSTPLFFSDTGDNITAGASGQSTEFLQAVLDQSLRGGLFLQLWNPELLQTTWSLKEGESVKVEGLTAEACEVTVIASIELPLSRVVRLSVGGNEVVVTEKRLPLVAKQQYERLGVDLAKYRFVVFKLGYLYPYPASMNIESHLVDTSGPASLDTSKLLYSRRKRPFFPIDSDCALIAG